MKRWQATIAAVLAILAGLVWWGLFDAAAPASAGREIDLAALRAMTANDASETLPREVRVEFVGESEAPSFAAEAGRFDGELSFAYPAFQIVGPSATVVIDAALDAETLASMSDGKGRFNAHAYARVLAAIAGATRVLITHEHLDHVMGIARHPDPDAIAPRLALTAPQLSALPQHALRASLSPAIASISPIDLSTPQRIAPGVVAVAAPGHSAGTILIYVRTIAREHLFIGDIAWTMSNVDRLRGRPRLVGLVVPGVDPDRPRVLRQLRALHDIAAAEPALAIVPAHDKAHLRALVAAGVLTEGFAADAP